MNTSDEDVARFLKIFTLLSFEQIEAIIAEHEPDRSQRVGQQQLAYYVTQTIFGKQAAEHAKLITELLFGQQDKLEIIRSMNADALEALNQATGKVTTTLPERSFIELCVESGLVSSNSEAKKMMQSGALWLNEEQIQDSGYALSNNDYINNLALLRKGKKSYATIYLLS